MSYKIPSEDEILAGLRQLVKEGLMEEIAPGKFQLTDQGLAYADALKLTPAGKKMYDDLDKAHQKGVRKQ